MRSPSSQPVIEWLSEIWANLDPRLIRESFDSCGITSSYHDMHSDILRKVLDGIDVTEYLEDIPEDHEHAQTEIEVSDAEINTNQDSDGSEFDSEESQNGEESKSEEDVAKVTQLLENSNIEDEEG